MKLCIKQSQKWNALSHRFSLKAFVNHTSKMLFSHLKYVFINGIAQKLENWQINLCKSREFIIFALYDNFYKNIECMNSFVPLIKQYFNLCGLLHFLFSLSFSSTFHSLFLWSVFSFFNMIWHIENGKSLFLWKLEGSKYYETKSKKITFNSFKK